MSSSSLPNETRSKTWERRINKAKKKHRPSLKNWAISEFAFKRNHEFLNLLDRTQIQSPLIQINSIKELEQNNSQAISINRNCLSIDKISCEILSKHDFIKYYEEKKIPVLIQNIPKHENWNANDSWNFQYLKKQYGERYFKAGEDDDGYKVKVRMKYFLKYLKMNHDDSPLYIFDSNYDNDAVSKKLLEEYNVPSYFSDDLFSLVGERRRPPYRWFLVGPERSGTCVHIDPLGTSAWNTLVHGVKRWILFPPGTPKYVVKGTEVIKKGEDDEATNYFIDILPRMKSKYQQGYSLKSVSVGMKETAIDSNKTVTSQQQQQQLAPFQYLEFIQYEGDTVFVPGGWWHSVINLTHTIAVTQNFCSPRNFPQVWRKTRLGRKKMSVKWLKMLKERHPDLATLAENLNKQDEFLMYDSKQNKLNKEREKVNKTNKINSNCKSNNNNNNHRHHESKEPSHKKHRIN